MIETIREPLSWVFFVSVIVFLYKVSYEGTAYFLGCMSKARKEREQKAEIKAKLNNLSPMERNMLDYVKAGDNCGMWLPKNDAGVLTLMHKGLLERIGYASIWEDWYSGREVCILATIPEKVKD